MSMGTSSPVGKTFFCIDLDRTLFDTERGANRMITIAEKEDPTLGTFFKEYRTAYAGFGVAISFYDTIVERAGEAVAQRVARQYVAEGDEGLLLPQARNFMTALAEAVGKDWGILTYGSDSGQRLKIDAVGISTIATLVTNEPHKGQLITSWIASDGFRLPREYGGGIYQRVVLVDDRLQSFEGLPDGAVGYWLTEEVTALDEIPMPRHVIAVKTLDDVLRHEHIAPYN